MTVLRSGSATDVGRLRKINQDLPLEADNLFAVADGMGGHAGGEVAAKVAVEVLLSEFNREPTVDGLRQAFTRANRAVWQEGQQNDELRGMGTTLTAMALVGGPNGRDTVALANVGDSRAYLFSGGQVTQITDDHSLAEERMRHGEMTEAEAAVHPQRHILTRVLGVATDVEADMWELQLRTGDRVVLCSDGLSNELGPREMADVLSSVRDPSEAAQQLVEVANEHGGADNITAVVVDVLAGDEGELPASIATPLGGAGSRTTNLGSPATGQVSATPSETLARGAQLGFTGAVGALTDEGERGGEFFRGTAPTAPVARSTVRAAAARRSTVPQPPPDENRGARRRRMGIPHRITFRVALFILLVAAVPVGALFVVHWYAYDNWFLSVHRHEIVIEQGQPGGVLWFDPKTVDRTGIKSSHVLPAALSQIRSTTTDYATLADAKRYVTSQHQQYDFLKEAAANEKKTAEKNAKAAAATTTSSAPGTTTTTAAVTPATTVPATTVPATTAPATTVPATTAPATTAP